MSTSLTRTTPLQDPWLPNDVYFHCHGLNYNHKEKTAEISYLLPEDLLLILVLTR